MLVRAGDSLLLAVLPASCRIDLDRLGQVLGSSADEIRLATAEELLATFSDCEPGVVPPFGRLYGLPTLVDCAFSESSDIVVSGNTRHEGLWMHFRDFAAIEGPERAPFSRPISPGRGPATTGDGEDRRRVG